MAQQNGGADDLRRLSRDLRRQADGRERMKQLRKELRAPAVKVQKDVKAAIRAIPSKGQSRRAGRRSLRAQLARSVTVQVRTSGRRAGVSVFMNPRKLPDGMKSLPAYMEATPGYERWRHPVFGNREVWVQDQRAHFYFTRTLAAAESGAARAARDVVERFARDLERDSTP